MKGKWIILSIAMVVLLAAGGIGLALSLDGTPTVGQVNEADEPGIMVDITGDPTAVEEGEDVTLTITAESMGNATLSDVSVELTGEVDGTEVHGPETLDATQEPSGDANGDGMLGPDETWTWTVDVTADETITYFVTARGLADGTEVTSDRSEVNITVEEEAPPRDEQPPCEEPEEPSCGGPSQDIVDTALEDERLQTLVVALEAADLVDALKETGPFTIFVPTVDAFNNLPEGELEALLADIPSLTDVLLYHVVPDKLMADDIVGLTSATTLLGEDVTFSVTDDTVMVNDAEVIAADIQCANGVIHVIDTVLSPPTP